MKNEIRINKTEFINILKELKKYTSIIFKQLAKDMPTSFQMDSYHQQHIYAPIAKETKLTDLSDFLWKSFESGAGKVDIIHDEIFINEQIEYFKNEFAEIEEIAGEISSAQDTNHYDYQPRKLDESMEVFAKLGKPAQLKIIKEGLLDVAIANYKEAKQLVEKRNCEKANEHHEWFIRNNISLQLKKRFERKTTNNVFIAAETITITVLIT